MPKAFVRVRQLSQTPIGNFLGSTFRIFIKLTPGSIPLAANFTNQNPPICNHVFRFECQTFEKTIFEVILNETAVFSKTEIARVSLPLNWFPINKIVEYWFPLKPIKLGTLDLFVFMEIHLSDNLDSEFEAPPGKLLVKPCWSIPKIPIGFGSTNPMPFVNLPSFSPPQQLNIQFNQSNNNNQNQNYSNQLQFPQNFPLFNQQNQENQNNGPIQWNTQPFFPKK